MSTATTLPVQEAPSVVTAGRKLAKAMALANGTKTQIHKLRLALNDPDDVVARLEARSKLPSLEDTLVLQERDILLAERESRDAYEMERARRRQAIEPELKAALVALRDALIKAAMANAKVRDLQYAAYEADAIQFTPWCWTELLHADDLTGNQSRLDLWLTRLSDEYGL